MLVNTKYRTDAPEIMDDFAMEGETLREALDKIATINQFLGGNQVTLAGVKKLLASQPKDKVVKIVDIGCGNGDMLRHLALFANQEKLCFELVGIDANAFTIKHAESLSRNFSNIRYDCQDIFQPDFPNEHYDIVLCTLTLHHFTDLEIIKILKLFGKSCNLGIVINDLHRSAMAYRLFQLLSLAMRMNAMSRQDGLVSILRGFKKYELDQFAKAASFKKYSIQWKWAFRFQWIIYKL